MYMQACMRVCVGGVGVCSCVKVNASIHAYVCVGGGGSVCTWVNVHASIHAHVCVRV